MSRKKIVNNPEAPMQTIPDAARISGISKYSLRKGCIDGTIEHTMFGSVYYINMPALYRALNITSGAVEGGERI